MSSSESFSENLAGKLETRENTYPEFRLESLITSARGEADLLSKVDVRILWSLPILL